MLHDLMFNNNNVSKKRKKGGWVGAVFGSDLQSSRSRATKHMLRAIKIYETCIMKIQWNTAGVYGVMVSLFLFFGGEPKTPCCACCTTHAVFVSWWPLAAARFMSLIPGSAPSIHFAAALSSQPNIKLLPIAQKCSEPRGCLHLASCSVRRSGRDE